MNNNKNKLKLGLYLLKLSLLLIELRICNDREASGLGPRANTS